MLILFKKMLIVICMFSLFPLFILQADSGTEDFSWNKKGEYRIGNFVYQYGFERNLNTMETNGIIIKYDFQTGDELFRIVYDTGYDEVFLYMAQLSKDTFAILSRNTLSYDVYHRDTFVSSEVLLYNTDGFLLKKMRFIDEVSAYGNVNYRLFLFSGQKPYFLGDDFQFFDHWYDALEYDFLDLQYQGKARVNGEDVDEIYLDEPGFYTIEIYDQKYAVQKEIVIFPTVTGVEGGYHYENQVKIDSNGMLLLNQLPFISSESVSEAGNYTLSILGERNYQTEIHFVIEASVNGIEDGGRYQDCLSFSSNAHTMYLNKDIYLEEMVCEVGKYEVILEGNGAYQKQVYFQILPSIQGIQNFDVKTKPFTIFVNGEAYLNGERMEEQTIVDAVGNYQIVLWFDGEIYQKIFFSYQNEKEETATSKSKTSRVYEIVLGCILLFGVFLLIKKK